MTVSHLHVHDNMSLSLYCVFICVLYLEKFNVLLSSSGTVRLYEVSGQCSGEAGLLQLKKPDDKLVTSCVMMLLYYNIIIILGVHWLVACGQEHVSYSTICLVVDCLCGRELKLLIY